MTPVFLPPTCPHTVARPANQPEEKGERKCRPLTRCGKALGLCSVAVTSKQRSLASPEAKFPVNFP